MPKTARIPFNRPIHLIWHHVTSSYSVDSKNHYEEPVLRVWRQ